MELSSLIYARKGGEVKRFHTVPTLQEQNIADHSFGVAMVCAYLAGQEPPGVGVALLMAALTHDLAEQEFGDMPAPAKRAMPDVMRDGHGPETFREMFGKMEQAALQAQGLDWEELLTEQEKRWLKLADAAEGCFRCIRERAMGNRLIIPVWVNFISYVEGLCDHDNEAEHALYARLYYDWKTAHYGR